MGGGGGWREGGRRVIASRSFERKSAGEGEHREEGREGGSARGSGRKAGGGESQVGGEVEGRGKGKEEEG